MNRTTHPTGNPVLRRAAAVAGLLIAVLAIGAGPASAHTVGGSGATSFQTTLDALTPAVPGLSLKVVENGSKLEIDNASGSDVIVDGYVGEPYLRVGPGGTFTNTQSPATYLDADRYGTSTPVPAGIDPSGPPVWRKVSSAPDWIWHDHRTHWMSTSLPPTVAADPGHRHRISTWTITLRRDGQILTASGHLDWVPGPSRWPWLAGALVLVAATAGTLLLPARRRPYRWLGLAALTLVAADLCHSLGVAGDTAGGFGPRFGAFVSGNVLQFFAWAAAVLAAVWLLSRQEGRNRKREGVWLAAGAGLLTAAASGLPDLSVLWSSSAPFAAPMVADRLLIVGVLGLGFGLAAALPVYLRRTKENPLALEPEEPAATGTGLSRRNFLTTGATSVGGVAVGAATTFLIDGGSKADQPPPGPLIGSLGTTAVTAAMPHQAGITTPVRQQAHGTVAAFDLVDGASRDQLKALLRSWTKAITGLTAGEPVPVPANGLDTGGDDSIAAGSGPSSLTVTVGIGPSLFGKAGLAQSQRPQQLTPLPKFGDEVLDPARSDGDLGVVVAADDPLVAFHALRTLTRLAAGTAKPRWSMSGFTRAPGSVPDDAATGRNLMGQLDGTDNPTPAQADFNSKVYAEAGSGPAWMHGGSYLVVRRIRMLLDSWDQLDQAAQERVIGRRKKDGAPLSGGTEHSPVSFTAQNPDGSLAIAGDAHIRLAAPANNGGSAMLRRGLSYHDGLGADGMPDAGLLFLAWQADPASGFIPVQLNLTHRMDSLNRFIQHETSALFAVLPAARADGYLGEALLEPGSAAAPSGTTALPATIADGGTGVAVLGADGIQRITVTADDTLRYHPSVIQMKPGTIEITFRDSGTVPHTLSESGAPQPGEPSAGVANLSGGQQTTMSLKLTRPGDYPFQCGYHANEGMYAVIEVR